MDWSPPGSSIHGISQARVLEWVAISSSRGSSQPRDQTQASCITGRFFTAKSPLGTYWVSEVTQSCPTLCDPMDCSLPSSSVHGILQARVLEWGAISFPRGSSWPRDWTWVSCIAGRFLTNLAMREARILILEIYKILTHPITHPHLPLPHTLTHRDIE